MHAEVDEVEEGELTTAIEIDQTYAFLDFLVCGIRIKPDRVRQLTEREQVSGAQALQIGPDTYREIYTQ